MASAKAIAQVQTESRTDNQAQQNIIQGVAPLMSSPLAVNNHVIGVTLAVGINKVSHGLGQLPVGMFVTKNSAVLSVSAQSFTSTLATFTSSAACTADIIFF